jgi:predicted adenylyl cyclase CyaB
MLSFPLSVEELEGKLVGVDVDEVMDKFSALGVPPQEILQEDRLFDVGRCTIRIRRENKRFLVTHKGELVRKGPLKSREELEFEVSSADDALKFISLLGIDTSSPIVRRKKLFRYRLNGATCELVFIDGLPPTLEIEGDEPAIRGACDKLGVRFESLRPISWSEIQPM